MEPFRIVTPASTLFMHVRILSLSVKCFLSFCFLFFFWAAGGYFVRTIQRLLRIGNETAIGPGNRGSHLSGLFVRVGLHSYTHGRLTAWSEERSTNAFIIQKFRTLRAPIISELSQTCCFFRVTHTNWCHSKEGKETKTVARPSQQGTYMWIW